MKEVRDREWEGGEGRRNIGSVKEKQKLRKKIWKEGRERGKKEER